MKKYVYIFLFTLLGVLLQFLIHAFVEIWYITLLLKDFPRYSLGLSWDHWLRIHDGGTVILLIGGILFGFFSGRFWWHKLYEK